MSRKALLSILTTALLCFAAPSQSQQAAQDFPDGPGKEIFVATCGGCHDINRARAGYSAEGWNTLVAMMQNAETPVPADQWPMLTTYLMKSFPEKPKPAAAIVAGPAQATIKLW